MAYQKQVALERQRDVMRLPRILKSSRNEKYVFYTLDWIRAYPWTVVIMETYSRLHIDALPHQTYILYHM